MKTTLLSFFLAFTVQLAAQQPPIYNIKDTSLSTNDEFGVSVAVSDEYIAVGCSGANGQRGALQIYKGFGPEWDLVQTLNHSEGMPGDFMGVDVAMTNTHIIVGAPTDHWEDNQTGKAFIYQLDDGEWKEQSTLVPTNDFLQSAFGFMVNIHEDYAIVGAPDYTIPSGFNGGAAVLYKRNGNTWIEDQSFIPGVGTLSSFGGAVDITDEWIAIGAYEQDFFTTDEGPGLKVFLYKNEGGQWVEKQSIEFENQNMPFQVPWHGVEFGDEQLMITNYRVLSNINIDGESKVYNLEGDEWVEKQIIHPEGFELDEIGRHCAVSDRFAITGANDKSDNSTPHHLLVYTTSATNKWELIGDYKFEDSSSTNWQGYNLDVNDIYAVASSHHGLNEHGDVYVIDLRRFTNNEDLLSDQSINIFPIPTYNNLTIASEDQPISAYLIFNHKGQVVRSESNMRNHQLSLNIGDLAVGNYWIKVITEEGHLYRQISKIE